MNPFSYGGVVTGSYFYNRKDEINKLKSDIKSGNNIILYAPRRYGKTSLITKVLAALEKENYNTIYLDFFNVIDRKKFVELYAKKILARKKYSIEEIIKGFKKFVKNIIPSVSFDNFGNPSFELSFNNKDIDISLEEVINLPENWGSNKEKWVVVFDEFQEINKLNGDNFEKQLRANIQFHKNVTYIFMGSKTHLLLNMFKNKSRAFYNIGKFFKLEKIPETENIRFIKNRFNKFNISLSTELIIYLLEVTENIPFYVQFLASELWQKNISTGKSIIKADIDKAIMGIITGQSDYYLELYNHLSQYQKRVLLALVESGDKIFSKKYSEKFSLSSASSTQRVINKLRDEGIVEKEDSLYQFSDPFFKKFLQLRFNA